MNYVILSQIDIPNLELNVAIHIKKGWAPQGGVTVGKDVNQQIYLQAMIKEK